MKLRTGEPWMSSSQYGRSLRSLSVNLLVQDIEQALEFQREVLGAGVVYSDPDFAVLEAYGGQWMLHADHTYQDHPFGDVIRHAERRGAGIELRLHGCDPDRAEAAARQLGYTVILCATSAAHGLREAYLADHDGYVWVPDVPA